MVSKTLYVITFTFLLFLRFFQNPENVTFYVFFCFVAYVFSNYAAILSTGAPCLPDFEQLNVHNGEMENCTRVMSFDYFSGSEAAYILTVFFVLGSVVRESINNLSVS